MQRMIARYSHALSSGTRALLIMLISRGIQCLCFTSDIQQTMVLRMVLLATPIGITLQRSILYTLASFGSYYSPKLPIHAYVQAFKSKLLAHMQGEQMLPILVYKTCPYPLHMVKFLGKPHESKKVLLNIFVKRLSSITKKGKIESPSLVLDN